MKIEWSPLAMQRLSDIGDYIAQDSPLTATRIVKEIFSSVWRLKQFTKSGRVVPELGNPEIREVIYPPYRILYQEFEETIEILTVIHGKQELSKDSLSP